MMKTHLIAGAQLIALLLPCWVLAQDISLPAPHTEGGKPLMQAIKDRQSSREFSVKKLPLQLVADILWSAAG